MSRHRSGSSNPVSFFSNISKSNEITEVAHQNPCHFPRSCWFPNASRRVSPVPPAWPRALHQRWVRRVPAPHRGSPGLRQPLDPSRFGLYQVVNIYIYTVYIFCFLCIIYSSWFCWHILTYFLPFKLAWEAKFDLYFLLCIYWQVYI